MLVLANGRGESLKELLHRFGVGVGQDEGETVVRAGLNASEDVGEREALVAQAQGALAASTRYGRFDPSDLSVPRLGKTAGCACLYAYAEVF